MISENREFSEKKGVARVSVVGRGGGEKIVLYKQ